jgi:hypothetical protein
MIDWNRYHLPPEAARIDRVTFRVWKLWHGWLRPNLGRAFRIACGFVLVFVAGTVVVNSAIFLGSWAIVATAVVVVLGVVGGLLTRRKPGKDEAPCPNRSWIVAVLLALLLAPVVLLSIVVLIALVSIAAGPVGGYGLAVLLLVPAGALAVGRSLSRRRTREASRYPPPLT